MSASGFMGSCARPCLIAFVRTSHLIFNEERTSLVVWPERMARLSGVSSTIQSFSVSSEIYRRSSPRSSCILWRDKVSLALVIGVPILQLILFGYAHQPRPEATADRRARQRPEFCRARVRGLAGGDGLFQASSARLAAKMNWKQQSPTARPRSAITIPSDFARSVLRGDQVAVLVEADASDSSATSQAIMATQELVVQAVDRELTMAGLGELASSSPVEVRLHRRYNPEEASRNSISFSGLVGVVLTPAALSMMSAMSLAREVEKGTMETLLILPLTRFEIINRQDRGLCRAGDDPVTGLVLTAALYVFNGTDAVGSFGTLMLVIFSYIAALVAIGLFISTIARTQMQAMQYMIFTSCRPSCSRASCFQFQGMPSWARAIGEGFP